MTKKLAYGSWVLCVLVGVAFTSATAADRPDVENDPETFAKGLTLDKSLKAQLWTSAKQLIQPVAICFDDQNRMYVTETHRFRDGGGLDIREAKFMYFDDIKYDSLADRRAMYEKWKDKYPPNHFTKNKEKIVILEDTSGKGRADKVTTFAEAFNDSLDGPAVGIAYNDGKIYFACVPKIWELTGATGSTPAEKINTFFEGFGVRVGISGHDVHGCIIGPDGKLYWSMGDRGYNVTAREGQKLVNPYTGGVFRANLDGSDLEIYYYGLRNPQELVFDEYGNLFTVDNNADLGDVSRFTYILEGGTTGWTMGWQLLSYGDFSKLAGIGGHKPSPWLDEGLWKSRNEKQPAWITPPAGHITNGPCGLTYNPGVTALPDSYARHFFVCDYTSGSNSGVHSFIAEEDGAGFALKEPKKMVWGITTTDVAFGYDGKLYICDYGGSWHLSGKGRVITVADAAASAKPEVEEIRKLFAGGFKTESIASLSELLKHGDMRVRQRAQFELVKHGHEGFAALSKAAHTPGNTLARVHGIWGIGQLAKQEPGATHVLADLLADADSRVREQAVKTLGDTHYAGAADKFVALLKDSSPRVRSFAAIALGKAKHRPAVAALIQVLRENNDKDAWLRHSAVMGLLGCADAESLKQYIKDDSSAVRLGVLLTFRRMQEPAIAVFLKDSDPLIYAEAIRAIYDMAIPAAMPQLAGEITRLATETELNAKVMTPLLFLRILNANYRYGSAENAQALAEFAAGAKAPEDIRIQALEMLQNWETPTLVDPVVGLPRAVPSHAKLAATDGLKSAINRMMGGIDGELAAKATEVALAFGIGLSDEALLAHVKNSKRSEALRVTAIQQLLQKQNTELLTVIPQLLKEESAKLRIAALDACLQLDPPAGIAIAREMLEGKREEPTTGIKVVIDKTLNGWGYLKMGGPSKADYADKNSNHGAVFTYVKGFAKPHEKAGAEEFTLPRLNDGAAALNNDDTTRVVWAEQSESRFLLDLQKPIEIAGINTFSWHVKERAVQIFTLWGSASEKMPDAALKDLKKEWTQIAAVDTSSLHEGGMQGSCVYAPSGSIGKFRYLLWQNTKKPQGTFYTEMDVYEKGQWGFHDSSRLWTMQQALLSLGKAKDSRAADILLEWMEKMSAGKAAPELHLEIVEAAGMRSEEKVVKRLAEYRKGFAEDDKLGPFRVALLGGDSKCGDEIFQFHAAACIRCHKVFEAGGDAGPKLAGVGTRLSREKILESLVDPNAVVVPGYGQATFKLQNGTYVVGSVVEENDKEIVVKQVDGAVVHLAAADIKKRTPPVSPMPAMDQILKPREMRDLIEFLSAQK